MAWYTGKAKLVVVGVGDSNIMSAPFTAQPGVVASNANNLFYANDDAVPYVQSGHTWRTLDPDATGRLLTQASDAQGDSAIKGDALIYANQLLGSNGSCTMSFADTFETTTGIPVYTYLGGSGGSTSADWIDWLWPQLDSSLTAAMAAIPATAADVIYLSMGGGDLVWGTDAMEAFVPINWRYPHTVPTAEQFYENLFEFRIRMIQAGWWVPGVTQIVINEIPRTGEPWFGAYPAWQGLAKVVGEFNDRIALISSVGRTYDPPWPIHYTPQSYADMGREAAQLVINQIPLPAMTGFIDFGWHTGLRLRAKGEVRGATSGGISMSGPLLNSQRLSAEAVVSKEISGSVSSQSSTNGTVEIK